MILFTGVCKIFIKNSLLSNCLFVQSRKSSRPLKPNVHHHLLPNVKENTSKTMIWYDIWYDMIWYDMIWYDMIWYDIWYDMIWYDMIWYMIYDIWYDMIWYDIWYMIWYDRIWYDTIWYDIIRYIWYDMIWCDVMWCYVMWCDVMWYDIWYDMIYLLTAIGLSPGGSSTVHIYTQTVHRTT